MQNVSLQYGDRIGSEYSDERIRNYCSDDNTFQTVTVTIKARACLLEWGPKLTVTDDLMTLEELVLWA